MKLCLALALLLCGLPLAVGAQPTPSMAFVEVPAGDPAYQNLNVLLASGVVADGAADAQTYIASRNGVGTDYQFAQIAETLLPAVGDASHKALIMQLRAHPQAVQALIALSQEFAPEIYKLSGQNENDDWAFQYQVVAVAEIADPQANAYIPSNDPAYRDYVSLARLSIAPLLFAESGRRPLSRWEFAELVSQGMPLLNAPGSPAPAPGQVRAAWWGPVQETYMPSALTGLGLDPARRKFQAVLTAHPLALAALTRLVTRFAPELTLLGVDTAAAQARLRAMTAPFPDVPKDHWAYHAVQSLHEAGIVIGEPNGRFDG